MNRKRITKQARKRRGKLSEERFIQAWGDRNNNPTWLQRVQLATEKENIFEATDAWMIDHTGYRIRVQVKSSESGAAYHYEKHPNFIGVVVVVNLNDNFQTIRENTLWDAERKQLPRWLYET